MHEKIDIFGTVRVNKKKYEENAKSVEYLRCKQLRVIDLFVKIELK